MKNNQEPFGFLSNGAQIVGSRDFVFPEDRTGVVSARTGDNWYLTAQNDPDLINISGDENNIDLEELTIADVNALRSLLATDLPEQLIAAAVAYGRGDPAPDKRRQTVVETDRALAAHFRDDDDPVCTVVDSGERSGIRLERYDWNGTPRTWLEFSAGRSPSGEDRPLVMVDVDIHGGRHGVGLLVDGQEISSYMDEHWSLADLRQLHTLLGKLIADPRLAGALAEQTI